MTNPLEQAVRRRGTLLILVALCLLLGALAQPAAARQAVDVYIQQPPTPAQAKERLDYAERLYAEDRFFPAYRQAEDVARDFPDLASEALFVMGKAAFALGDHADARYRFDTIRLRHASSRVVTSGQLAEVVGRASEMLLDDLRWTEAGPWLDMLGKLDTRMVDLLADRLEFRLTSELAAFNRENAKTAFPVRAAMQSWFERQSDVKRERVGQCAPDDAGCNTLRRQQAQRLLDTKSSKEQERWTEVYQVQDMALRREFAARLQQGLSPFAMLARLATDTMLLDRMQPKPAAPESPYRFSVISENRKTQEGLFPKTIIRTAWLVETRRGSAGAWPEAFVFQGLERPALLERLSREIFKRVPVRKDPGGRL
ncbi:MAG: hypothetical protein ABIK45_14755 [Pseudomonadota bacterium]